MLLNKMGSSRVLLRKKTKEKNHYVTFGEIYYNDGKYYIRHYGFVDWNM